MNWKMNLTRIGKVTLAAVLLQAIVIIVLEASISAIFLRYFDTLGGYSNNGPQRGVPVYLAIFIIAQIFQIILCWDAMLHKNTIQIVGFICFNVASLVYSLFQYFQMVSVTTDILATGLPSATGDQSTLKVLLILIPVVISAFLIMFCYLAYRLYKEFGWKIYKKIGADPHMRRIYRHYQVFLMMLKLDVFFFLGFGIQFLVLVVQKDDPEFALTILAIPITFAILALAVYGVRREDKWIMILTVLGFLGAIAYFLFKIIRIWTSTNRPEYQDTKNYLTLFSVASFMAVIITIINGIVCTRHFGMGLKEALLTHKTEMAEIKKNQEERDLEPGREIDTLMV